MTELFTQHRLMMRQGEHHIEQDSSDISFFIKMPQLNSTAHHYIYVILLLTDLIC